MKERKAREIIDSPNVSQYPKLPKRLRQKFDAFDKLDRIKPQESVRLYRADFIDLDNQIRQMSGGKRNAATVQYRGLPILSYDDR